MMMLLILTSVLGYELKTAVGTSVFIMTFTALTGAVSHFAIGGAPDSTARFFAETCAMDSFVVMTGFTMNLMPRRNVMKTEKFPMVVDGTRLEM